MARKAECRSLGEGEARDDVAIMAISKRDRPWTEAVVWENTTAPATCEGRNEINERYAIPRRTAREAERENRESSYGSAGSMSRGEAKS